MGKYELNTRQMTISSIACTHKKVEVVEIAIYRLIYCCLLVIFWSKYTNLTQNEIQNKVVKMLLQHKTWTRSWWRIQGLLLCGSSKHTHSHCCLKFYCHSYLVNKIKYLPSHNTIFFVCWMDGYVGHCCVFLQQYLCANKCCLRDEKIAYGLLIKFVKELVDY